MNKSNHGGKRPNTGRKPKYTEKTKVVSFRIPISKVDEVRKIVGLIINELRII